MPNGKPWNKENERKLIALYQQQYFARDIADALNETPSRVWWKVALLKKAGVLKSRGRNFLLTPLRLHERSKRLEIK